MPKKAMLITVGTGKDRKDIAQAICLSIREQNPNLVKFITSDKTEKETLPLILENPVMKERPQENIVIQDENDVEKIYKECKQVLQKVISEGYEVSVDYTSGTKAMSAGACLAAVSQRANTLVYTHGARDTTGRVIPGTERMYALYPNLIYIDQDHHRFVLFFNKYSFSTCLEIAKDVKNKCERPEVQEQWNFLEKLAFAYYAWDKFELKEASDFLNQIDKSPYLQTYGLKSKIERHKQILHKEQNNNYCEERIIDLLQNARRRAKEGKFDDAVARLYRLLEYLAQYVLYTKYNGFETSTPNYDKLETKEIKEKYKDKKLGLTQAYSILRDLRSPLGNAFFDRGYDKKLSIRNDSILAHGFNPVGKGGYPKLLEILENMLKEIIPEIDTKQKDFTFPELTGQPCERVMR
ncbi:MAG: TIGR02710 family CRISPR-associated CARF protein [Candidatus Brocadiales bacterium]